MYGNNRMGKKVQTGKDTDIDVSSVRALVQSDNKALNSKHYFYILKFPDCGMGRIKIGKSAAIYNRFKYYLSHFGGVEGHEDIEILATRLFNKDTNDRLSGKGLMYYSAFEARMKQYCKHLSSEETEKGNSKEAEWFDEDKEDEIMDIYNRFIDLFLHRNYFPYYFQHQINVSIISHKQMNRSTYGI
jgi:hypothetical protein